MFDITEKTLQADFFNGKKLREVEKKSFSYQLKRKDEV